MRVIALFLVLSAVPATAQVRPIPAEAGRTPLSRPAAPIRSLPDQSSSFSPRLTASLGAPLSAIASAPSAAAAMAARADAAGPVSIAVQAEVKPLPGAVPPPAAVIAPLSAARSPDALAPRAFSPETRADISAPEGRWDALFDGARALPASTAAAMDGPALDAKTRRPLIESKGWKRALKTIAVSVPAAAAAGAFAAASPHLAMAALHGLGQAAYWLANPFAFLFTLPQIYRILERRSASVSEEMMVVGLAATLITTLNFAFDSKDLMMYRNLAQALGFAAMLGLKARFSRAGALKLPGRRRALVETGLVVALLAALLPCIGPVLLSTLPGVALMHSLLVPFQIVSGFGFTFLMYAQLTKMRREQSVGDSSTAMMWAYLGTKTIWIWSLATMLSMTSAAPWLTLPVGVLFGAACWAIGRLTLSRVLKAPWSFLPERVSLLGRGLPRSAVADLGAFFILSALILALSGAGFLLFSSVLGIPAAMTPRFAMYLLYSVQSLVACLATLKTLRLSSFLDRQG